MKINDLSNGNGNKLQVESTQKTAATCVKKPTVSLRLTRIPHKTTIRDVWNWFAHYGSITWIEVFDKRPDKITAEAKIIFEPPPSDPFWGSGKCVSVTAANGKCFRIGVDLFHHRSTVNQGTNRAYPSAVVFNPKLLQFGSLVGRDEMFVAKSIAPKEPHHLIVELDTFARSLTIWFNITQEINKQKRVRYYRASIPITSIQAVYESTTNAGIALVVPLPHPPKYYYKDDEAMLETQGSRQIWNSWVRTTDICDDRSLLQQLPISTYTNLPDSGFFDAGRMKTIRLVLPTDSQIAELMDFKLVLRDLNVLCLSRKNVEICHRSTMWESLDEQISLAPRPSLHLISQLFLPLIHLDFQVRYLLEVCVCRGYLNEYSMGTAFLAQLSSLHVEEATRRLDYVVTKSSQFVDPLKIFEIDVSSHTSLIAKPPKYCAIVQKVHVTPTGLRLNPPNVESSNRVLRRYDNISDRFMRVQFLEETEKQRIGRDLGSLKDIWKRVKRALDQGIRIGDRTYEFLVFGSSQIKEASAVFFCPTSHVSCNDIRQWMGSFDHIRNVAKYGARLGQCFSTSREIQGLSVPQIVEERDIENDEYCFTDGVGIISPFLARCIASDLGFDDRGVPSAFQIRMGGVKGVLAAWPKAKKMEVHIRNSQVKFKAPFNRLEVLRCSGFSTATLNRQTIVILENLGVKKEMFLEILIEHISLYDAAIEDANSALQLLTKFVDETQSSLVVAEMLNGGFEKDPFVINLIKLWRTWNLKHLREKARVHIEQSAFVLGVVDETGTLRGHSKDTEGSRSKDVSKLPQIFLQMTDLVNPSKATTILKGVCVVGRNPSLHVGDVRIVEAVDNPALHHLRDVVVFPSIGDQDIPSMLSGGDLDGDDYFVIWDPRLIPTEWNFPPMNYQPTPPKQLARPVTNDDLKEFFVEFLMNDRLGLIAHAHLCWADREREGAKSQKCLKLAVLHSIAVDYQKNGTAAQLDEHLVPRQWPHFMEKRNSYRSQKALGLIYDKIADKKVEFIPERSDNFDKRVLDAAGNDEAVLREISVLKGQYDVAIRRLMAQKHIETEFEVFTGWAMSKPAVGTDYKRQEDLGRDFGALRDTFRGRCQDTAMQLGWDLWRFVAAMYKVTHDQVSEYLEFLDGKQAKQTVGDSPESELGVDADHEVLAYLGPPLTSFPWIFHVEMGRVANGIHYTPLKSTLKSVQRQKTAAA